MAERETKTGLNGFAKVFLALVIVGAINWGLIGFFNFNLVDAIFRGGAREETSGIARIVYALVGLAGVALTFYLPRLREARPIVADRQSLIGQNRTDVRP